MIYSIDEHGDDREKAAWSLFAKASFPAYQRFWLKHVVELTRRPTEIGFLPDIELRARGKSDEDVAIAQLHYTVIKHLLLANDQCRSRTSDEYSLFISLSSLCAAQDVAFELLQRYRHPGCYDPWLERRPKGKRVKGTPLSGQDAQNAWKSSNDHLQDIREYRNKLMHGRTPPAIIDGGGMMLPKLDRVDQYCDWRRVSPASKGDFEHVAVLFNTSWLRTLHYFETNWSQHLLP